MLHGPFNAWMSCRSRQPTAKRSARMHSLRNLAVCPRLRLNEFAILITARESTSQISNGTHTIHSP